ncbi:bile acid:sodium symporter family protein [Capnocytophaga canimorsus]|uniref:bile acid:sodium symporter family protein n=1 Tax=Capnocytophaga canimorsus TaxID=28188 RepID=UPI000589A277|nr:bile acid:sodium symporter [Capnocytophaga canimorsus]GIM58957.1 hypothetical protein CAPN007_11650 [Capnocytophaga canimorsus]CEN48075.1 BASS family bile acid:Na+ symporter [Capnocytophaga canimorsus]VEJ19387.1 bile acid transporter [Capnocytophaga canimorsus]
MLIDVLIQVVLALIMFVIGSSLSFRDFKKVFGKPKPFYLGLVMQMVLLPSIAFVIAFYTNLPVEYKVGFFIVSICPGGTTSNFISYLVNADTALSIALTCVNSVLILVTIPLLTQYAIFFFIEDKAYVTLSFVDTLSQVFLIIILPAVIGLIFNKFYRSFIQKTKMIFKIINTMLLGLIFAIKFFATENTGGSGITTNEILQLLPYCLLLHLATMLVSYFLSIKTFLLTKIQATTIGIEVGLQNTTLALLVTGTLLKNTDMTKPALVFAMFSFFTTLLFAIITMQIRIKK